MKKQMIRMGEMIGVLVQNAAIVNQRQIGPETPATKDSTTPAAVPIAKTKSKRKKQTNNSTTGNTGVNESTEEDEDEDMQGLLQSPLYEELRKKYEKPLEDDTPWQVVQSERDRRNALRAKRILDAKKERHLPEHGIPLADDIENLLERTFA